MGNLQPFHVAFPVDDLDAARRFYVDVLGCGEGRSSAQWIDFELFGHQVVAHLCAPQGGAPAGNGVDGVHVPVPHFGVVLEWRQWHEFADRLRAAGVEFVVEPCVRFAGQTGEQATMFFRDPAGNALEFKSMRHADQLFAKQS